MMQVKLLLPHEIAAWECRLLPLIAQACARSRGRYAAGHVLQFASHGDWQIWLVLENDAISFVLGTELILYPTGLKALAFRFGTGRGRERWQHRIDDVLAHAKAQGCTTSEGVFRRGWRRVLPGWNHTHDYLERSLS